jgi:regulatory protein
MEITKISVQIRNPERVNLQVDGRFYRGLDRLVAIKLGLKPGLTLTPKLLDQLETTQSENSAWEWALRSLQTSPKSVTEMQTKLRRKFEPTMTDKILGRLQSADLLNDQRLAEQIVGRFQQQGTKSKKEILLKLRQKGIVFEIAKTAVAQIESEAESAVALARIKNRSLKPDLVWQERYKKLAGYLARKGFGYSEIRRAVTRESLDLDSN